MTDPPGSIVAVSNSHWRTASTAAWVSSGWFLVLYNAVLEDRGRDGSVHSDIRPIWRAIMKERVAWLIGCFAAASLSLVAQESTKPASEHQAAKDKAMASAGEEVSHHRGIRWPHVMLEQHHL
jgi:hypothetical protein